MTDQNFLKHILGAIDRIESYTENCSEVSFMNNFLIQDAVMRNLEIIGEPSKKISSQTRSKAPSIPWKEIAGMRDKLIHVILVLTFFQCGRWLNKICPS